MKTQRFIFCIYFIFFSVALSAQDIPQSIVYQVIAQDASGRAYAEKDIVVEISILRGSETGDAEYRELHYLTTDRFGYFTVSIGSGQSLSSARVTAFSEIEWESDLFFLHTAVDFGASDFINGLVDIGSVPFESVPYAFSAEHAITADSLRNMPFLVLENLQNVDVTNLVDNQVLTWNASAGKWIAADPGSSGSSFLRSDGSVDLSEDWTISTNSIFLVSGNLNISDGTLSTNNLQLATGERVNSISRDSSFSGANNQTLATQKAVKYYVDSLTKATYWTGSSGKIYMQNTAADLGIGTSNPIYKFHFTGEYEDAFQVDGIFGGAAPSPGAGTRMAFYPAKAAFRAGRANENPTVWDDINIGAYSAAFGYDNKAGASYSFASGKNNSVTGSYSAAFGADHAVTSSYVGAFGLGHTLGGLYSFSAGKSNITSATASVAFGQNVEARGVNSLCFGNQVRVGQISGVGGANSLAGGSETVVEGDNSVALGTENTVKASSAFVGGNGNYVGSGAEASFTSGSLNNMYGMNALMLGFQNKLSSFSQVVFGQYNFQIGTDYANWNLTDGLFILGNGSSEALRSNAFVVLKNANTGIGLGQNSPAYLLEVGKLGDGTVAMANSWNTLSDRRLKTNIERLKNANENLQLISAYTFNWEENPGGASQIGFLAQEVEAVYPSLVHTNKQGIKSLDYAKLCPVLWEAVKNQQKQISDLQEKLDAQEKRLQILESKIR